MIREKTIFRNFLFGAVLLAGAALAASCSVDKTDSISDMNAISFRTEFTRATATTINNLNEFTVWGWKTDGNGDVIGTLMNGVTAANSGNGTYETTDRTYYWPGCAVDFLAVSPLAATVDDTNDAVYIGETVVQYEVDEVGGTAAEYTGYFAEGAVNADSGRIETLSVHVPEAADEQADLLYAYTPGKSTGKVPMNFRHALAQVEFKALNTNSWMTVEVAGVKVASVANHGELVLPTAETSATDGAYGTWTLAPVYDKTEYAAGLDLGTEGYVSLGSEATALTADGGSLFLIPQTQEAWVHTDATNTAAGAYFLISCRIEQFGVELWPGDGTFAEVAIPFAPDWEQGKKYTYTFSFGEGAGYYPPTSDTTPGDPILDGPIAFTVEVGDLDSSAGSFNEDDEADTYVVVTTDQELRDAFEGRIHRIVVEADIELSSRVGVYSATTLVIEDGYTITIPNSTDCGFTVEHVYTSDEASFVIDGDGTIATTGTTEAASICCIWVREGYVVINSCTFKGGAWNTTTTASTSGYCVYCEGLNGDAIVEINGGYFESGSPDYTLYCNPDPGPWEYIWDETAGTTIVQHPDEYEPYTVNFIVNGGNFYMYNPSSYVSSGHSAGQNGEWYVVK